MKTTTLLFIFMLMLVSCGRPSPQEVANKYCSLKEKYMNAPLGSERDKAKEEMRNYEKRIKATYKDEAYQYEIRKLVDDCADEIDEKMESNNK